jgi:hypothetical protein
MKGVDEVHLLNITVAPDHQGQGWGRVMLDALAIWSRGQGAQWLWLEVRVSNQRALQIYERHGYRRVGERKGYYPPVQWPARRRRRHEPAPDYEPGLSGRTPARHAGRNGRARLGPAADAPKPHRRPSLRLWRGRPAGPAGAGSAPLVHAAPAVPGRTRSAQPPSPSGVARPPWTGPALRDAVAGCQACKLCEGRTKTVFGVGDERADWLIVGEAPGEHEDLQGEPFVGQAGKLLDNMLKALGNWTGSTRCSLPMCSSAARPATATPSPKKWRSVSRT